jgi:hypothetical protein
MTLMAGTMADPLGLNFDMAESSQQRSAGPMRLPALFSNPFTRSSSVYSPDPNLSTVNGPSTTPRISFRGPFGWRRASPSVAAPPSPPPPLPPFGRRTWLEPADGQGANWRAGGHVPEEWPRLDVEHARGPRPPTVLAPESDSHGEDETELERRRKREAERRRRKRRHHQQRGWVRGGRRNANHRHSRHYNSFQPVSSSHGIRLAGFAAGVFLVATVAACTSL